MRSTVVGDGEISYVDVVSIAGNDVSSRGTTSLSAMLWAAASRCCAARGGA